MVISRYFIKKTEEIFKMLFIMLSIRSINSRRHYTIIMLLSFWTLI